MQRAVYLAEAAMHIFFSLRSQHMDGPLPDGALEAICDAMEDMLGPSVTLEIGDAGGTDALHVWQAVDGEVPATLEVQLQTDAKPDSAADAMLYTVLKAAGQEVVYTRGEGGRGFTAPPCVADAHALIESRLCGLT